MVFAYVTLELSGMLFPKAAVPKEEELKAKAEKEKLGVPIPTGGAVTDSTGSEAEPTKLQFMEGNVALREVCLSTRKLARKEAHAT